MSQGLPLTNCPHGGDLPRSTPTLRDIRRNEAPQSRLSHARLDQPRFSVPPSWIGSPLQMGRFQGLDPPSHRTIILEHLPSASSYLAC